MLNKSCLYISDYIERNKDEYYDCLTRVRTQNDMIGWIKFFLTAVIETSKIAKDKFKKVVEFTMEMDRKILNMTVKPENAKKVLDVLYDEPAVNRKKLVELTGITESTIKNIINNFVDKGILVETTGYTRNQIFKFHTIKTDKFKTNLIAIMSTTKLNRENVTKNALIPTVLKRGTKNLKTQEEINKKLEEMYGASLDCSC